MLRSWLVAVTAALVLVAPSVAEAKVKFDRSFAFPKDRPARIVVFRPDVQVGSLGVGGVEEPNADWTKDAREKLTAQLVANQKASGNEALFLAEQEGDKAQLVADYQALFKAVAGAIVQHKINPAAGLPTKKDKFDWTLGAGAAQLGEIGGGDYGLFIATHDAYGTGGRKAMQIMALLAFGAVMQAGVHQGYAALVELKTGRIVWFNMDPGTGGDPRTDEGASKRVGQLLAEFPTQTARTKVAAK